MLVLSLMVSKCSAFFTFKNWSRNVIQLFSAVIILSLNSVNDEAHWYTHAMYSNPCLNRKTNIMKFNQSNWRCLPLSKLLRFCLWLLKLFCTVSCSLFLARYKDFHELLICLYKRFCKIHQKTSLYYVNSEHSYIM